MSRSKRVDVLDAAEAAFYEAGIAASGVDGIAERAGVSKRTLYNHFPSKDALVVAYLERRETVWRDRADTLLAASGEGDAVARLAAYVEAYLVWPTTSTTPYRGCAMLNAAAELPDDHPALDVVRGSKRRTVEDLEQLLGEAGAANPTQAARRSARLLEGTCSRNGALRQEADVDEATATILALAGLTGSASAA